MGGGGDGLRGQGAFCSNGWWHHIKLPICLIETKLRSFFNLKPNLSRLFVLLCFLHCFKSHTEHYKHPKKGSFFFNFSLTMSF